MAPPYSAREDVTLRLFISNSFATLAVFTEVCALLTVVLVCYAVVRFLMKLCKTVNNEIIRECCSYFKFPLPSELSDKRRDKFQSNFMLCTGILHCFGIKT